MFRLWAGVALAAVVAIGLTGCVAENRAASYAATIAEDIADRLSSAREPRTAEYLAAGVIVDHNNYRVEALDWSGDSADDAGARIELRIVVTLPETTVGGGWVQRTLPASEAVRCWRFTASSWSAALRTAEEFGCPDGAAERIPTPEPLPALPEDVEATLVAILEGVGADEAHDVVAAAFPEDYYSIEIEDRESDVVVALGIPTVLECVVAIASDGGGVEVLGGWPRDVLQPGEGGCSPGLLTMTMPA